MSIKSNTISSKWSGFSSIVGTYSKFIAYLLASLHLVILLLFFKPAISTPDAQGYYTQAKLISTEKKIYLEPQSPLQYMGPHWLPGNNNRFYTTFPPGLPILLAVVYSTAGAGWILYVNPIMASLSVLGFFFLCRYLMDNQWALAATGFYAINPMLNEHSLFGDSHVAVVCFLVWSLVLLLAGLRKKYLFMFFTSGLMAGCIPTIRYPEILFCVSVSIFIILKYRDNEIGFRELFVFISGLLFPIIILAIHNQYAFQGFWKTGYGLATEPHFGWKYIPSHAFPYVVQLLTHGIGTLIFACVPGIVLLLRDRKLKNFGWLFIFFIIPSTLLYMSYYWQPDPQLMRFLLPTFPFYLAAGFWFLYRSPKSKKMKWFTIILMTTTFLWAVPKSYLSMNMLHTHQKILADTTGSLKSSVPKGSILITYDGLCQNLDFWGDWKLVNLRVIPEPIPDNHQSMQTRNPRYQSLFIGPFFQQKKIFMDELHKWGGNNAVYLLVKAERADAIQKSFGEDMELKFIKELPVAGVKLFPPPGNHPPERFSGPMAPNRIFDFVMDGTPLVLMQWHVVASSPSEKGSIKI